MSKDTVDFAGQFSGNTFSANDINSLYGKTLMADIDGRSGFVMPNFGFGVYSNNYTTMQFNDPTFPTFNMNLIGASSPKNVINITDNSRKKVINKLLKENPLKDKSKGIYNFYANSLIQLIFDL